MSLKVYNAGTTSSPFGDFLTPIDGSMVSSSIAVTGWVLDDVGVDSLKIYINNGQTYIGDAVFVEGARPDLEGAYPDYPQNYQAGWGYMLLTNFLPGGGNGVYTLTAKATDVEGKEVSLGNKTITVDNENAVKPFGAIDTPLQGGSASGSSFKNQGWVLTPQPNKVPENGSTIDVYVDGVKMGNPQYNIARSDIADYFPGYANSGGPAAIFTFDTTAYGNGIHSIYWIAVDNAGNADGIGSRFFLIQNSGSNRNPNRALNMIRHVPGTGLNNLENLSVNFDSPVKILKGYGKNEEQHEIYPDNSGLINIGIRELERVVIRFPGKGAQIAGYMEAGDQFRPLPVGSTFDTGTGTFSWQPGPGFFGDYELVFIAKAQNGEITGRHIRITIYPRYTK